MIAIECVNWSNRMFVFTFGSLCGLSLDAEWDKNYYIHDIQLEYNKVKQLCHKVGGELVSFEYII